MKLSLLPLTLILSLAQAKPGDLVPFPAPDLSATGTVSQTAIADDQSVFIMGDFHAVDGTPRPGLAKLRPSGQLDESFNPAISLGDQPTPFAYPVDFRPSHFGGFWYIDDLSYLNDRPARFAPWQIFALDSGRLFVRNQGSWTVLDASGQIDPNALSALDRNNPAPVPQYRRGDQLFLIDHHRQLIALDLTQGGLSDPTFTIDPTIDNPILQALPTNDGLWILSKIGNFDTILRLHPDGNLDESFPPLELRNGLANRLVSAQSRGFAIVSYFTGPYTTCDRVGGCGPPSSFSEVRWFNEIGGESGNIRIDTTLGTPVSILVRTFFDALVLKGSTFSLQSTSGDQTVLTEMSESAPWQSPLFPFTQTSLDFFGTGPLFQRSLLIGGTQKFTIQGQAEPGHHRAQLTTTSTIQKTVPQPDGSYFISGTFTPGLAKVLPDGTLDPTFIPTLDLRNISDFEVRPNGRVIVMLNRYLFGDDEQSSGIFFELSPSGEIVRNYSGSLPFRSGSPPRFHLLQDQSIILSNLSYSGIIQIPQLPIGGSYSRLLPNGELDPTWILNDPNQPGFANPESGGATPFPLLDGRFMMGRRLVSPDGTVASGIPGQGPIAIYHQGPDGWLYFAEEGQLSRWHPAHGPDDSFRFVPSSRFDQIRHIQSGSRNKLYLFGQLTTAVGPQTVIRLHSTGQIDHSFCPPPLRTSTAIPGTELILTNNGLAEKDPIAFSHPVIPATSSIHDDKLILFGVFDQPGRNIAALADTHTTGYREWITATTGADQYPSDDFDGDGTNNFGEYALGTHPAFPDRPDHQLTGLPPRVFGVPCNPEALEVSRRIEVSNDLKAWRPATAADLTLETRSDCFRYRVQSQARSFFTRVVTETQSN